jgi:hypothetical protein
MTVIGIGTGFAQYLDYDATDSWATSLSHDLFHLSLYVDHVLIALGPQLKP